MTSKNECFEDGYAQAQRDGRITTVLAGFVAIALALALILPEPRVEQLDPSPAACQAAAESAYKAQAE